MTSVIEDRNYKIAESLTDLKAIDNSIMTIKGNLVNLDKDHLRLMKKMLKIKNSNITRNRSHGVKGLIMEIEGAFKGSPLNCEHDGSVSIDSDYTTIIRSKKEIKKAIHNYFGESKSDLCTNDKLIKKYIFDIFEVHLVKTNSSCGFHIHILVRSDRDYSKLMTKEFWCYFLLWLDWFSMTYEINNNHRWFNRIGQIGHNANSYCQRRFNPSSQINVSDKYEGDRYCFINFCRDVLRRIKGKRRRIKGKTLEFRVFCLFKSKWLSYTLVKELKKMINAYLNCDEDLKFYDQSVEEEYWRKDEVGHNGSYNEVNSVELCDECHNSLDDCSCNICGDCSCHYDDCECNRCDECGYDNDDCRCE